MSLSIIIPTFDEAATIATQLDALQPLRGRGVELLVVDGGSRDATRERARPLADWVLASPTGRAAQMNAGAIASRGDTLLFLHADTRLPPDADRLIETALSSERCWGRFDVRIDGRHGWLPIIAAAMNWRSRVTGIATGDQAIFMTRKAFIGAGGFPEQPLMEDIEMSRRLKQRSAPVCLAARVVTSGRRWETRGVWRTMLLMWWLRWRYWRGESPDRLAKAYRDVR